jgi:hypothetical protein
LVRKTRLVPGGSHGTSPSHSYLRLAELGITLPSGSRRPPVRACLDWTERRPHLGGAVGAALCDHALTAGWLTRIGTTRALAVTPAGRRAWQHLFGLPPAGR